MLLIRAGLVILPFAVWFLWREIARRTGREMGSTPWAWLVATGAALVALSLIASVVLHTDNREQRYVPGEVTPSGEVSKGYFETPKTK